MGLLGVESEGLVLAPGESEVGSSNFVGVPISRIRPRRSGAMLVELMELDRIDPRDRAALLSEFDPDRYSQAYSEDLREASP
jgi:hypothetical protein